MCCSGVSFNRSTVDRIVGSTPSPLGSIYGLPEPHLSTSSPKKVCIDCTISERDDANLDQGAQTMKRGSEKVEGQDGALEWDGSVLVTSSMTNETFASLICDQMPLLGGSASITISNNECHYLLFPTQCLNNTQISNVNARCVVFGSFNWNSSESILFLGLSNCLFSPGVTLSSINETASDPMEPYAELLDGFDEEGSVNWDEFFELMPNIRQISISSGNLRGMLPSVLPSGVSDLSLNANLLTGTISPTLFSQWSNASTYLSFNVNYNNLTGTLPPALLAPLEAGVGTSSFFFDISHNALTGPIPDAWFQPLHSCLTFQVMMSNNKFNGTLPANLFRPSNFFTPGRAVFSMDLSSNEIEGSIPEALFQALSPLFGGFSLYLDSNKLTGTLPSSFWPNGWDYSASISGIYIKLQNNMLSGTVPATILTSVLTQTIDVGLINIVLSNNQFEGSIPNELLYANKTINGTDTLVAIRSQYIYLGMSDNRLNGPLPTLLFAHAFDENPPISIDLKLGNNELSGDSIEEFLEQFPLDIPSLSAYFTNNSLSGSLPSISFSSAYLYLDFTDNEFTGTIPASWINTSMPAVWISENIGITGAFPPALFQKASLFAVNISYTSISGELPTKISPTAIFVDMRYTNIDFCSPVSNASLSTFTGLTCDLEFTSACECSESYSMCLTSCPPETPIVVQPISQTCPNSTRPSLDFVCIDNVWTAKNTNASVIVIPSNAGSIVITGNATSTSIVINGLGTTITIEGCASNLSNIVVELSANDIAKMSSKMLQTLIVLSSSASQCTNLGNVILSTTTSGKTCKKVKAEKVLSADGRSMSALFTVSSSGCNTWWIILVAVVVSVIVLGTAAAVVAGVLWNRNKASKQSKMLRGPKRALKVSDHVKQNPNK